MGLFFQRQTSSADEVEAALTAAYARPQIPTTEAAAEAKQKLDEIKREPTANIKAFVAAAAVFLVLLVAAFVAAQMADAQTAEKTFTQDLAGLTQTLLTAWSAAVLGLIGGEAVGAKT